MSEKTTMTEEAATTTEGDAASQSVDTSSTGEPVDNQADTEQQDDVVQDEQDEQESSQGAEQDESEEGAPDEYEFEAPEGQEFDGEIIEQFSDVARELGLSQDDAQKVLDKMAPAIAQRQAEQIEAVQKEWEGQSKADKEFGGDKLGESLGYAKKAMESFATPELKGLLNETGMGNHPEVIRMFVRVGKAISEDGFVSGRKGSASGKKSFYPNSKMN